MLATSMSSDAAAPKSATHRFVRERLHRSWQAAGCCPARDRGYFRTSLSGGNIAVTRFFGISRPPEHAPPTTCMHITASFRATAIFAVFKPFRLVSRRTPRLGADNVSTASQRGHGLARDRGATISSLEIPRSGRSRRLIAGGAMPKYAPTQQRPLLPISS